MKKAVDKTFESIFILEEIRQIWRETAPLHKLSDKQKKKLKNLVSQIEHSLKDILKEVEDES
ncbi:hypothetical protein ACFLZP_02700 [Patescibacteria group bacterium]